MSETTTETPPEGTPPEGTPAESGNAEAARYRTRLRETETERDALAGRVQAMQTAEVVRIAAEHIEKPDALWAAGVELASLLDKDGAVDPAAVKAAAEDAADRLGLEKPKPGGYVPQEGRNGRPGNKKSFEDAFKL